MKKYKVIPEVCIELLSVKMYSDPAMSRDKKIDNNRYGKGIPGRL